MDESSMVEENKIDVRAFVSPIKPTWCPGCGNFAIFNALKAALVEKGWGPKNVVLVFDIGCNGNGADKIHAYAMKGLHGRVLPLAAGIKLANDGIPVIAMAGDGGTLDEGMHHFIHSIRNNYDITFLMHNNENFGLTTGQETPTTPKNQPMPISPWGVISDRLNPMRLAIASGSTFVASAWSGNQTHLKKMILEGINHLGFSYINIYQHCPTYNEFEDMNWLRDKVYDLQEAGHDKADFMKAIQVADMDGDKRAIGVLYQNSQALPYLQRIPYRKEIPTNLIHEVQKYDVTPLMEKFK